MKEVSGNVLRGHLETMILSVLESGEAHGFQILQQLEQRGSGALRLKEGSLYPALYRLEEAGMIAGAWEGEGSPRKRGPRRRIYTITPQGRKSLHGLRKDWRQFVDVIGGIIDSPGQA